MKQRYIFKPRLKQHTVSRAVMLGLAASLILAPPAMARNNLACAHGSLAGRGIPFSAPPVFPPALRHCRPLRQNFA